MPVQWLQIGGAVLAGAGAIWLVITMLRRPRRVSVARLILIVCLFAVATDLALAARRTAAPSPVFNSPTPVADTATIYSVSHPPASGQRGVDTTITAVSARTGASRWQQTLPSEYWRVIATADTLYAASQASSPGIVIAFDGADGIMRSQFTISEEFITGTPMIVNGEMYLVVTETGQLPAQRLLALRATDGARLWSALLVGAPAESIEIAVTSSVVIVRQGTELQALRAYDGKLVWHATTDSEKLAAAGDVVVAVDTGTLIARRAADGTTLWRFGGPYWSFDSVVPSGDTLFVASRSGPYVNDAKGNLANPETVSALALESGTQRWRFVTRSGVGGTLTAGGGAVYIIADDGISALGGADGHVRWHQRPTADTTFALPVTTVGPVLYLTYLQVLPSDTVPQTSPDMARYYLSAVSADNGSLYWMLPTGPLLSAPPHGFT